MVPKTAAIPMLQYRAGYRIQQYGQRWLVITFFSILFIGAALFAILARHWPFSQQWSSCGPFQFPAALNTRSIL
ncbi:MAG: hypothetical protein WBC04_24345 [Candidatus Acidiferrales bacterium]